MCRSLVCDGMAERVGDEVAECEHVEDTAEVDPAVDQWQVHGPVLGEGGAEAIGRSRVDSPQRSEPCSRHRRKDSRSS